MLANVNATRMELLSLRKRVALASRGHHLLSEKRDEISRQLIQIARAIQPLRKKVEQQLLETCRRFMLARAMMEPEDVKAALEIPTKQFKMLIHFSSIMSVKVPNLAKEMHGDIICYGFASTSGELDVALLALEKAFDSLIELAQKEKQARLLAIELQMTRRRVNVTRLMKIADMIRA
ncbi:MAG: V-type ATP synthase subunit D [Planctomycetota bacterium]|jgi:V/A-type H+-transporting ATPase subunit D